MKKHMMKIFWSLPLLSNEQKEKTYYFLRKVILKKKYEYKADDKIYADYAKQILSIPDTKNLGEYIPIAKTPFKRKENDPKLIAYYLPQFYPFKENDDWWGKGTTEWNNVSKAVPQFLGHYQPRLPGELGYYDLRLKENIVRQVELAKLYGIYAFCYYYYWFDGKRLLDEPLDLFLESSDIDFPFCLCWANENWTRRFESISGEVIMKQSNTVESYKKFIESLGKYITDERYLTIDGKKVLIIYQPLYMPDVESIIKYWRSYCKEQGYGELYIIAVRRSNNVPDYLAKGFDAVSEFQPMGTMDVKDGNVGKDKFVCSEFYGTIYDYKDIVENKKYFNYDTPKLYRAVMPMWDNTARRDNKGSIYHGSSPDLYEKWMADTIKSTKKRHDLDDQLILINAWNEWGEGAYLEPDRRYGYAYLQATRNAVEKSRL